MARLAPEFWDTKVLLQESRRPPQEGGPEVRTGILNVYEAVHNLLARNKEALARLALEVHGAAAEPLTQARILAAARLRVRERHRKLSYADAAGYVTARDLGAVFVTTDRGFVGLPGVRRIEPIPD